MLRPILAASLTHRSRASRRPKRIGSVELRFAGITVHDQRSAANAPASRALAGQYAHTYVLETLSGDARVRLANDQLAATCPTPRTSRAGGDHRVAHRATQRSSPPAAGSTPPAGISQPPGARDCSVSIVQLTLSGADASPTRRPLGGLPVGQARFRILFRHPCGENRKPWTVRASPERPQTLQLTLCPRAPRRSPVPRLWASAIVERTITSLPPPGDDDRGADSCGSILSASTGTGAGRARDE